MPHPKKVVAAIDAYLAAVAAGDLDGILALYAADATLEDPVGSDPVRGPVDIRAFYERALAVRMTAERVGSVRVAGSEAAFAFTLRMPDLGMTIDVIETMAFDDDARITSMRAFWGPGNITR